VLTLFFSSRCRFFVIFQPFFDPSKRPPKWLKMGLRAVTLGASKSS
jgi:hypothetical protein